FVANRVAARPQPCAIIGILVVRGTISLVEAAEPLEERARRQEQRSGTEIDRSCEVELRTRRIAAASVRIAGSIRPDNRSRLLQAAVRKHQLAANRTHGRRTARRCDQRLDAS